jgi:AraC-like DNA-binding protein
MKHGSWVTHHIKALPPALRAMGEMGFNEEDCLRGTGLTPASLLDEDAAGQFTLEQEYNFHRNLLQLSGDPLLGLKLGKAYTLNTYGLFGYAFLSAQSLRHALTVTRNFGLLTFTPFLVDFLVSGKIAAIRFSPRTPMPEDLQQYYADRDATASIFGGEEAMDRQLPMLGVSLSHGHSEYRTQYEEHFGCPVDLAAAFTEVRFGADILDTPMPQRDAETSSLCQQQCQRLLARLSQQSALVDEVRALIVARPGFFPDIDYVAEKLRTSTRTLRRRLAEEDSSYQDILNDVRYNLARDYLSNSTLPLEEISLLLGYSTPGNFTYASRQFHLRLQTLARLRPPRLPKRKRGTEGLK